MKRRKGWIYRWDGTADQLLKIKAQSLRGMIWIAFWTEPGGFKFSRILPTRVACEELEEAWKNKHRARGWRVWGFSGATWACETQPGNWNDREVFVIHKFSPDDLMPLDDGMINYFRVEA